MTISNYHAITLIITSLGLGISSGASAAPPPGRLLASQCAQCHGTDGRAVGDMDSLRGESAGEIYDELQEMKYSAKTNDIMHRQAKGYTDQQLWLIATYYAGLSNRGGSGSNTAAGTGDHEEDDDD